MNTFSLHCMTWYCYVYHQFTKCECINCVLLLYCSNPISILSFSDKEPFRQLHNFFSLFSVDVSVWFIRFIIIIAIRKAKRIKNIVDAFYHRCHIGTMEFVAHCKQRPITDPRYMMKMEETFDYYVDFVLLSAPRIECKAKIIEVRLSTHYHYNHKRNHSHIHNVCIVMFNWIFNIRQTSLLNIEPTIIIYCFRFFLLFLVLVCSEIDIIHSFL